MVKVILKNNKVNLTHRLTEKLSNNNSFFLSLITKIEGNIVVNFPNLTAN